MTVGYGDYYATNKDEMGFDVIILIIGPTWVAFTMGKAIGIINSLQQLNGNTNIKEELNMWISNIEEKYEFLPLELKKKINTHFINFWKNDRLKSL